MKSKHNFRFSSIKGQLYIFSLRSGSVFFLDYVQNEWKQFKKLTNLENFSLSKLENHTVPNLHFCPKIQLDFTRKLSIFLGEKLVKMLWFWTF